MDAGSTKVLIVDDEPWVCRLLEDVLTSDGFSCTTAADGKAAIQCLEASHFDVALLDLTMPMISGMDVLKFISARGLPTRAICMTGVPSNDWREAVRQAGAFDVIPKPFEVQELSKTIRRAAEGRRGAGAAPARAPASEVDARLQYAADAEGARDSRLHHTLVELAGALVRAVEAKDPYTRKHSEHVAFYAQQLARHIAVPENTVEAIRIAALLHDIGKIAVPDSVLTKPGRLSRREFLLVRQHSEVGAAILEHISSMKTEATLVRHHHERWDGKGYPHGLAGEDIPLGSRILNIADSMDAMLMSRTYKPSYPVEHMVDELMGCAASQFDPDLARAASQWCRENISRLILPFDATEAETA